MVANIAISTHSQRAVIHTNGPVHSIDIDATAGSCQIAGQCLVHIAIGHKRNIAVRRVNHAIYAQVLVIAGRGTRRQQDVSTTVGTDRLAHSQRAVQGRRHNVSVCSLRAKSTQSRILENTGRSGAGHTVVDYCVYQSDGQGIAVCHIDSASRRLRCDSSEGSI